MSGVKTYRCGIIYMSFILFILSTFLLIDALITKKTKLGGSPVVTKKDSPKTYKLYLIFYSILISFSVLCMIGLIETTL